MSYLKCLLGVGVQGLGISGTSVLGVVLGFGVETPVFSSDFAFEVSALSIDFGFAISAVFVGVILWFLRLCV